MNCVGPTMPSDVISLKRSIEAHEHREVLFRKVLDSYLFALEAVWRHNKQVAGALPQTRLAELRTQLLTEPSVPALDESRAELEQALRRLMEANRWQEGEIREILKALAQATSSISDRNTHYNDKLCGLAGELEELSQTEDLLMLRIGLQSRVVQFRECLEKMRDEQAVGIQKLVCEMQDFRQRLQRVEEESSVDGLTGLQNRRFAEARMQELIVGQRRFSIILLDINRFKLINDRFGHLAGDAALREFGTRLRGAVRTRDFPIRWGGDEFLMIVEAPLPDAISLSRRIFQAVTGRYYVLVDNTQLRLDVTASMGVAEHRPGEGIEQVFARADAGLYEAKGPR